MAPRLLFLVGSIVFATVAVATAAPGLPEEPLENVEGQEPPTNSGPVAASKAPVYRWMWGDAGKHTFGHWLAELNPFRWSIWADTADTIKNLEQYKKHDDQHRPVQIVVGPPPLKTLHYSNIGQAVKDLSSYSAPGKSGPAGGPSDEDAPSYHQEVATKQSYPPGVFVELGGNAEAKFESEEIKMAAHSSGHRVHWADVAELMSLTSVGLVLLGVLVAALRRKILVPERILDEEATSSEVLPWVEQGNLSASESDIEQQFLRLPLRLKDELE